jgi:hypothetical protein
MVPSMDEVPGKGGQLRVLARQVQTVLFGDPRCGSKSGQVVQPGLCTGVECSTITLWQLLLGLQCKTQTCCFILHWNCAVSLHAAVEKRWTVFSSLWYLTMELKYVGIPPAVRYLWYLAWRAVMMQLYQAHKTLVLWRE